VVLKGDGMREENVQGPVNAGCLIKKGDSVLLVKDFDSGRWGAPGGKPEAGETPQETAERETYEETGLKVQAQRLLETFEGCFYLYECRVLNPEVFKESIQVPESERHKIEEIQFIEISEICQEIFRFPGILDRIKALFNEAEESF